MEEFKKLQISKDAEISKLNDINVSKQNEIERLKNIIDEQKNGTREKQIEEENKKEKEKLSAKINDLELKIYNLNDSKNNLIKENEALKEQMNSMNKNNVINTEENKNENINNNGQNEKGKSDKEDDIEENKVDDKEKNDNKEIEKIIKEKEDLLNDYEKVMKEKSNIEEEKSKLNSDYNILLEEKNKIKKEKEELNEEYNKLKSEYDKLKEEFDNNEIKLKTYIAQEKINENKNNDLYLTKLTELDELKLKISKFESGEIIPDIIKEKMTKEKSEIKEQLTSLLKEKEKNYMNKLEEKEKKILEYVSKIKQRESKIKILNENIMGINTEKGELENIVIKQETRVGKLGEKVDKIELLLKNKNDEIRENETYSLKLINIIKEQKNIINHLKMEHKSMEESNSKNEDFSNIINSLKAQITALKKKLDVREDSYVTLQKSHKILQDKYLKTCSNNRKKEQEILLKQAKKLRDIKLQREKEQFVTQNKNKNIFDIKKELKENNYTSLNNFRPKKSSSSANKNMKEEIIEKKVDDKNEKSAIQIGPVLPIIKSSKNKERIERMKRKSEDDGKLEEISDMMNNIINEF